MVRKGSRTADSATKRKHDNACTEVAVTQVTRAIVNFLHHGILPRSIRARDVRTGLTKETKHTERWKSNPHHHRNFPRCLKKGHARLYPNVHDTNCQKTATCTLYSDRHATGTSLPNKNTREQRAKSRATSSTRPGDVLVFGLRAIVACTKQVSTSVAD